MHENFHEFASMFPLMKGEDFEKLVEDIKKYGQRECIVMLEDKVLDGRNRWLACKMLGIKPRLRAFCNGSDGEDPLAYVWSANVARRHLTNSQISLAITKRMELYSKGEINQHGGSANQSEPQKFTAKQAAKVANVSPRQIERAKNIIQFGTSKHVEDIETGKRAIWEVDKEVRNKRIEDGSLVVKTYLNSRGGRLKPPAGLTILQWVKQGIAMENDGVRAEEAAKKIGLNIGTYRRVRDLAMLSERDDLTPHDAKLLKQVIEEMETLKQVRETSYQTIRPIVDRVWGQAERGSKVENHKVEAFEHAVNVIHYSAMAKVELPQISADKARMIIEELVEAIDNINTLINRIKETYSV